MKTHHPARFQHHRLFAEPRSRRLWMGLWLATFMLPLACARAAPSVPDLRATELFERHKAAVLRLDTRLASSHAVQSSGSAFLISAQGLALSNYQGVADHLYRPKARLLSYVLPDGRRGTATVLAIDVVNDLALLQTELREAKHIPLPTIDPTLQPGDALFALGNPEDLGMSLARSSYSGRDLHAGPQRLQHSAMLNRGMNGGPTLNAAGDLVGINAPAQDWAPTTSLLVPVSAAQALVKQARLQQQAQGQAAMTPQRLQADILQQLLSFQESWSTAALQGPWKHVPLGAYRVPEFYSERLRCQGDDREPTRWAGGIQRISLQCQMGSAISLNEHTASGRLSYSHTLMRNTQLSAAPFANEVDRTLRWDLALPESKGMARQMCVDKDVLLGNPDQRPVKARVIWCAQGYRQLPGLYDINLALATRETSQEALVSRLNLEGVSWVRGLQLSQRFLKEFQ